MFTGIVEGVGRVLRVTRTGAAMRLTVDLGKLIEGARPGDSLAVDGVCLTIASIDGEAADFDVSAETLRLTTLAALNSGDEVNLERALRVGDRLGGHFVTGHVDGTGTIDLLQRTSGQTLLRVKVPREIACQLVLKGSVALDGISLTVAALTDEAFSAAIVPHTLENTTLRRKKAGDRVNLETDLIGKYVLRFLESCSGASPHGHITKSFLAEHGFA